MTSGCIKAWRTGHRHQFTWAIRRSGSTLDEPIFCLDNGGKLSAERHNYAASCLASCGGSNFANIFALVYVHWIGLGC